MAISSTDTTPKKRRRREPRDPNAPKGKRGRKKVSELQERFRAKIVLVWEAVRNCVAADGRHIGDAFALPQFCDRNAVLVPDLMEIRRRIDSDMVMSLSPITNVEDCQLFLQYDSSHAMVQDIVTLLQCARQRNPPDSIICQDSLQLEQTLAQAHLGLGPQGLQSPKHVHVRFVLKR